MKYCTMSIFLLTYALTTHTSEACKQNTIATATATVAALALSGACHITQHSTGNPDTDAKLISTLGGLTIVSSAITYAFCCTRRQHFRLTNNQKRD